MKRLVKIMVATIGLGAVTASIAHAPYVSAYDIKDLCRNVHSLSCEAYIAGLDDGLTIGLRADINNPTLTYRAIIELLKKEVRKHPTEGDVPSWMIVNTVLFENKELKMRNDCHHEGK